MVLSLALSAAGFAAVRRDAPEDRTLFLGRVLGSKGAERTPDEVFELGIPQSFFCLKPV